MEAHRRDDAGVAVEGVRAEERVGVEDAGAAVGPRRGEEPARGVEGQGDDGGLVGLPDAEALGGRRGDGLGLRTGGAVAAAAAGSVLLRLVVGLDLDDRGRCRQPPGAQGQGARRGVDACAAGARGDRRDGLGVLRVFFLMGERGGGREGEWRRRRRQHAAARLASSFSLALSSPLSSLFSNPALTPASVHSTDPVLTLII